MFKTFFKKFENYLVNWLDIFYLVLSYNYQINYIFISPCRDSKFDTYSVAIKSSSNCSFSFLISSSFSCILIVSTSALFKVSIKSFSVSSFFFSSWVLVSISLNINLLSFSDCNRRLSKLLVKCLTLACSFSIDSIQNHYF